MVLNLLANGEILPETFEFLGLGWWIVHVIAIPLMFVVGYMVANRKGKPV